MTRRVHGLVKHPKDDHSFLFRLQRGAEIIEKMRRCTEASCRQLDVKGADASTQFVPAARAAPLGICGHEVDRSLDVPGIAGALQPAEAAAGFAKGFGDIGLGCRSEPVIQSR